MRGARRRRLCCGCISKERIRRRKFAAWTDCRAEPIISSATIPKTGGRKCPLIREWPIKESIPASSSVFYGNQRQLEYDFVVAPGADPKQIALDAEGAKTLKLDAKGNLVMGVSGGEVRLLKPVIYQETAGERREIAGNYEITRAHRVTFSIENYDRNERLVIDPVLDYSTYLGGGPANQYGIDTAFGIAVDSSGDAYVTGQTFSTSFPTTAATAYTHGPLGAGNNPNGAVFVTELNPGGTSEVYSTYLIGTDTEGDYGLAIALDPSGKIYVAGQTFSTGFPVTPANAAEATPPANITTNGTAFLSKIDPTMSGPSSLVYSSYLGGSGGDFADAVAADASGNAYLAARVPARAIS